jgi:hypothetical protein
MTTQKPIDTPEVLRKLKARLEEKNNLSEDERRALAYVVQELPVLQGIRDDRFPTG